MTAARLAAALLHALPQTQCRRCGYADCKAYADAMADGEAEINRCPPGGAEGIVRLGAIAGRAPLPLDPTCGREGPRALALVDESRCIGCALCLKACPVDAIVGAAKHMHTVIDALCTGCELCLPVCPVDCISLVCVSGERTGWAAWSAADADVSRHRYAAHTTRLAPAAPLASADSRAAAAAAEALARARAGAEGSTPRGAS